MSGIKLDPNKDITYFAKTNHRNSDVLFGVKRKDRRQHMYVLGKSGTGKSVLLSNMIIQNIANGEGVCVVDPHGELVEFILESIPEDRVNDVIYFNPADTEFHVGFNVFEMADPKYKHLVASGLMGIFTKIWANAWSARMEYILNNAILALLDTPGSTLLGIPRLLVDKEYRQKIIGNLKDPVVKAFWVHEYEAWQERFRNEAIAPIQNKVGQFLSSAIIRNVVGQAHSTIDIFDIMNSGKIFLVNVSKGRIGEDNSALLGGMLITKVQLAAMERVRIPEEDRKDFYLYVDEFQNFATESFAGILSEARKYRLNLILAHQYIAQLATPDSTSVRDAVFGNVGTMIVFRVGAADAEFLEKEFEPEFMPQDLVNLPNYHIYLKLMVDGVTSRPFSARTLPPFEVPLTSNMKEKIIEASRRLYTRPRAIIEDEINNWSGMMSEGGEPPEGKFKAECTSCHKTTLVPFEPQEGRPVYCRDCMLKIKNGELQPVRGFERQMTAERRHDDLAALGIEFKPTGNIETKARDTRFQGPREPRVFDKPRRTADKSGLQEILKEALSNGPQKPNARPGAPKIEVVIEKPQQTPISLSELKKKAPAPAETANKVPPKAPAVPPGFSVKIASDEHKNQLKDALAAALKAKAPQTAPMPAPAPAEPIPSPAAEKVIEKEPETQTKAEEKKEEVKTEKKEETPKESVSKNYKLKNTKEVPEEVLRKILE